MERIFLRVVNYSFAAGWLVAAGVYVCLLMRQNIVKIHSCQLIRHINHGLKNPHNKRTSDHLTLLYALF